MTPLLFCLGFLSSGVLCLWYEVADGPTFSSLCEPRAASSIKLYYLEEVEVEVEGGVWGCFGWIKIIDGQIN